MKKITPEQLKEMLQAGRKLVWATLYERQDYAVEVAGASRRVRDVTDEPTHHTRPLIGQK